MRRFLQELKDVPKKCDWVLLLICLITAAFGLVVIASATSAPAMQGQKTSACTVIQLAAIIVPNTASSRPISSSVRRVQ